ncbi:ankyrin repeat domain-containing protein 17-like isoform X2 [Corticium candelabrum]|uniref:ankyrin repeat domain-containing protein 17-like isoform X2 n=1 Tax=Corticium candelabrum TaxID=121492 RepID=UPI002E2602A0|nr:ankyrin repeat domain-containing protein 17-like isoform X2 [Corticium candelabrum]
MGAGASSEALFDAVCVNDVNKASAALEKRADVNVVSRKIRWYGGVYGLLSALQVACADSSIEMVDLLLQHQANINYHEERFGQTALHCACVNGHLSIVEKLLAAGCKKEARDRDGVTALHYACLNGHLSIVKKLLSSGWDKEARTNDGVTALHYACLNGHLSIVKKLLSSGWDKEARTNAGQTYLHFACMNGHLSIVEKLLSRGCQKDVKDNNGSIPLHLSCSWYSCYDSHLSIVKLLISSGADVSTVNNKGQTPLQAAEEELHLEFGSHKERRSRIISYLKELNENSSVAAGNSASNITDSTAAVADNDHPSCTSSTAVAASDHSSTPVTGRTRTTTPILRSPTEVVRTVDQQLVQQQIQQIEKLTQDGLARDRQIDDLRRQNDDLRQQITHLQVSLRDEQLLKEDAVGEERREKEDLRRQLQRERDDKRNVQKDLDEARQQIEEMSVEQENLMRLQNEEQLEKANILELLSDADAAIERYKQERENEVFNIPSHDIQLTGTELGRGSYGAVCIGYWCGCPVAVKRLYDEFSGYERYIQLVKQEASVAWKIHHPNIAAVCGVTLEKEVKKAWIIMELHSGSVSSVIDACQEDATPLTLREKVDMAHDSLCGLDHIHSMQPMEILHGDICPRNILVTATMRAKLGDLGAARFQDASLSAGLLSPEYTAPERFDAPALPKSKETDMYSMAVTLCELFTAVTPDRRKRMDQVLLIRQLNVRSLCKHLMRDNPATRPTAAESRNIIGRIRVKEEYKACPPKRMVKGKMDGVDVTLVQPTL